MLLDALEVRVDRRRGARSACRGVAANGRMQRARGVLSLVVCLLSCWVNVLKNTMQRPNAFVCIRFVCARTLSGDHFLHTWCAWRRPLARAFFGSSNV